MAIIQNTSQPIIVRGVSPAPVYSRVISLILDVTPDGNWYFATTPVVGNDVWLYGVTVRFVPKDNSVNNVTAFNVMTGYSKPVSIADFGAWERVLPIQTDAGTFSEWYAYDGVNEMSWVMSKRYQGDPRRFGIYAVRIGDGPEAVQVSFHISEG